MWGFGIKSNMEKRGLKKKSDSDRKQKEMG